MPAQVDAAYFKRRPLKGVTRVMSAALVEGRAVLQPGRWLNPLVFTLHRAACAVPQLRRVTSPVYILGTGRSGTTVLGTVLSFHRGVSYLNEPKGLWYTVNPGADDLIGSYTETEGRYRLGAGDATEAVIRRAHRLYGAYLTATGGRRVVDKYPEMIFRVPYLRAIFPDAKFLVLVRNGWDTCASIDTWSTERRQGEGDGLEDWWGKNERKWRLLVDQVVPGHPALAAEQATLRTLDRQADRASVEWITAMHEGLELQAAFPDCVHTVYFEELAAQPEKSLGAIERFCAFRPDEAFLDYGRATLRPLPHRDPIDLHPALRAPFQETMQRLGYEA